jgi:hypothetical protein
VAKPLAMNGEATLTRKGLQMGRQLLDVVPHRTARGSFNEVTLELAVKAIAHTRGKHLKRLLHDRRVLVELLSSL